MNLNKLTVIVAPDYVGGEEEYVTRKVGDINLFVCEKYNKEDIRLLPKQNYAYSDDEIWQAAFRGCGHPTIVYSPSIKAIIDAGGMADMVRLDHVTADNFDQHKPDGESTLISNEFRTFGSVSAFIPGVMEKLSDLFDSEKLLISFLDCSGAVVEPYKDSDDFEYRLFTLRMTNLAFGPDDFLTNNLYTWDKEKGICMLEIEDPSPTLRKGKR